MKQGTVILLFLSLFGCAGTNPTEGPSNNRRDDGSRVFYLSNVSVSEGKCTPPSCELRLYSPATGEETLFLSLPEISRNIVWERYFESIYYRLGGMYYQAPWRQDAAPRELFRMENAVFRVTTAWYQPLNPGICDPHCRACATSS